MVIVAELVKRLIVVQEIMGSSPIFHTKCLCGEIGKHTRLKTWRSGLLVRFQSGVQKNLKESKSDQLQQVKRCPVSGLIV